MYWVIDVQIEREGVGKSTNLALAKQVLSIFEEIGGEALENYKRDIEEAMVEASGKFYSRKALDWMATMSYDEYMLKVNPSFSTASQSLRFSSSLHDSTSCVVIWTNKARDWNMIRVFNISKCVGWAMLGNGEKQFQNTWTP